MGLDHGLNSRLPQTKVTPEGDLAPRLCPRNYNRSTLCIQNTSTMAGLDFMKE